MHIFVLHCSYEQNGWTALNAACKAGHISVAEKLVRHGADVNILYAQTVSALMNLVVSMHDADKFCFLAWDVQPEFMYYIETP
jgi:ankyrin repeat protein